MTATSVCSRREWVESTEGGSEGGDNLSDEAIEANVVDGLVVEHDGDVGVLEERVGGEHRVFRLAVPTNHE
jgi:hypothetical protein